MPATRPCFPSAAILGFPMIHNPTTVAGAVALALWMGWVHPARAQPVPEGQPSEADERAPSPSPSPSPSPPPSEDTAPVDRKPDQTLLRHRTAFDVLTERTIGRTSRRVRFDWRRSTVHFGATGALPAELNNFESLRAGGFVRFPGAGMLFEASASYVWVRGTESTERLALTPYRQPGRPNRLELDFSGALPLAEGLVTALPRLVPAAELVLNAHAHFRYRIYPRGYADMGLRDALKAVVSGSLSDAEQENLESQRLPGMEIDPARYDLLAGLGTDVYFQSGLFFSHKMLVAVPLLQFINDTKLGFGFELAVSMGIAL